MLAHDQPSAAISLDPASTALVIVDMQNDFCHPEGYYARVGQDVLPLKAATAPIAKLLERARDCGTTIVFTRLVHDESRGAMEERHVLRPRRWTASGKRLLPGTWGAEVIDELAPRAGELVIDKAGYSGFDDTALEGELRSRGIRTVLLTGVVTYACVLATAFSAFDRGFDVLVASDAVGSWNETLGRDTHQIVDLLMGHAVPSDEIELRREALSSGGLGS